MGIQDLFNEAKADLLGIFPHYLHVSRLIQRAEIEVNEQGTVATAAAGKILFYIVLKYSNIIFDIFQGQHLR